MQSELFLICLTLTIEDASEQKEGDSDNTPSHPIPEKVDADEARLLYFKENLPRLTPTETKIYTYYTEGKTTKEIMALLTIKENTLKYHKKTFTVNWVFLHEKNYYIFQR